MFLERKDDRREDTEEERLRFGAVPQGRENVPEGEGQRHGFSLSIREKEKNRRKGISTMLEAMDYEN